MIIENLLDQLRKIDKDYNVVIQIDNCIYPANGFEDSTSIGIWEIRYWEMSCDEFPGIKVENLINLIPMNIGRHAVTATRGNRYLSYKITGIHSIDDMKRCIIEVTNFKTDNWWED